MLSILGSPARDRCRAFAVMGEDEAGRDYQASQQVTITLLPILT